MVPVEIDSTGQKTSIGFDLDEEPEEVADRFLRKYGLPVDFRQQIIDFTKPMLDRDAARRKHAALNRRREDDFAVIAAWRGAYQTFLETNVPALRTKVLEFNAQLADSEHAMTDAELAAFGKMAKSLADATSFHSVPFTPDCHALLRKLTAWPTEKAAPVLDCARILMLQPEANSLLSADAELHRMWFAHAARGQPAHQAFVLRILANWVARRKKSASEREAAPAPDAAAMQLLLHALTQLAPCAASDNKTVAASFALFAHNAAAWVGRFKLPSCALYAPLLHCLAAFFAAPEAAHDERSTYFALVALGAVCLCAEPQNGALAAECFAQRAPALLSDAVGAARRAASEPVRAAGEDLKRVLKLA